jgi:hypothetical protein
MVLAPHRITCLVSSALMPLPNDLAFSGEHRGSEATEVIVRLQCLVGQQSWISHRTAWYLARAAKNSEPAPAGDIDHQVGANRASANP